MNLQFITKGLFTLFLSAFCFIANSQSSFVVVEGTIFNETGEPLYNTGISVFRKDSFALLAYENSGNLNSFSIKIKCSSPDSLLVKVSYSGYHSKIHTIYAVPGNKYKLEFSLQINYTELSPITITPPPIWKRGDTTFFNISAFKDGDERKLIDILFKLPGFRINESGDIFYKGKRVEKVRIGGEELFADKPELLARTFPIHVLKNIQALENQSRNELLKGLEPGEIVILNLDLDKKVVHKVFGDAEIGMGTLGRYKFNPVAFSVAGKIKSGLISNNNNAGNNTKTWNQNKNHGALYSEATSPLISTGAIPYIDNFSNSRYINNTTFDNRFQVNIPISKSIKTNTELTFIHDKSKQLSNEILYLYSDSVYKQRFSNTVGKSVFSLMKINELIEWDINKKSSLKINNYFIADYSQKNMNMLFFQNDSGFSSINLVKNKWRVWQINGNYTMRYSFNHAIELSWNYSHLNLPQNISGYSPFLNRDFPLPDSSYTRLVQPTDNLLKSISLKLSYFSIFAKRKIVYNFYYNQKKLYRNSVLQINKENQSGNPLYLKNESGTGVYILNEFYTDFNFYFSVFNTMFSSKTELGAVKISSTNNAVRNKNVQPKILISLNQKKSYSKILEGEFELVYKQIPAQIYSLSTEAFPNGFASYQSYRNIFIPSQSATASYRLNFSFKNYSVLWLSLNYQKNYTSAIFQPSFDILSSISIDSTVRQPSSSLFSLTTYTFPFLPLGIKINLFNSTSRFGSLSNVNQSIFRVAFLSVKNSIEAIRNWNKKTFLTLKFESHISQNIVTKQITNNFLNKTVNNTALFSLKQKIGKTAYTIVSLEWIKNSSSGFADAQGLFADIDFKKEFPQKKIALALKLENIANQANYRLYNSYSPLFQSLLTIPLIKRNLMISGSWSF